MPAEEAPKFSVGHLDRSVDPSEDFYQFATGAWTESHPVPADKVRWSAFDELLEQNFCLLRDILEEASRSRQGSPQAPLRKVGAFFAAAVDSAGRSRHGLAPISPDLTAVSEVADSRQVLAHLAHLHREGFPGVFSTGVAPDEKDSSVYAFYLVQGGLSLPDRDYYLLKRFAPVRTKYRRHLVRMFALTGERSAQASRSADAVLNIERALARASRSRVDLRDALKNYNRFTREELAERYPRLPWSDYLSVRSRRKPSYVIVGQPEYFDAVSRLLESVPAWMWRAYLRWQLIHASAPLLDPAFEDEDFSFFHRQLLGQQEPEPEWKRAAVLADRCLGEALGKLYVDRHFPPNAQQRVAELVRDLTRVVRDRLERVPWMTRQTRERALAKFDRFTTKIGRPKKFRSYGALRISRHDHLDNVRRARAFEIRRKIRQIGQKVDRDEWEMTPPTVNAQFDPTKNEILFPAGILQPPFFDPTMDDPVNFGGIAVVIGHEITHGYDDQGRKYDADGNLRDWWTPADAAQFQQRAKRIVEQYSRFEPLPGSPINGELTMGENIADLGGVSLAFEALERRLANGRTPRETVDGFTPEQRFFLSYAQIWRGNVRDEEVRRRLTIDPHSPGRFRVNGVLANLPEFWKAFDIPPGSPMRQDESRRVTIW